MMITEPELEYFRSFLCKAPVLIDCGPFAENLLDMLDNEMPGRANSEGLFHAIVHVEKIKGLRSQVSDERVLRGDLRHRNSKGFGNILCDRLAHILFCY